MPMTTTRAKASEFFRYQFKKIVLQLSQSGQVPSALTYKQ